MTARPGVLLATAQHDSDLLVFSRLLVLPFSQSRTPPEPPRFPYCLVRTDGIDLGDHVFLCTRCVLESMRRKSRGALAPRLDKRTTLRFTLPAFAISCQRWQCHDGSSRHHRRMSFGSDNVLRESQPFGDHLIIRSSDHARCKPQRRAWRQTRVIAGSRLVRGLGEVNSTVTPRALPAACASALPGFR